ncbi:copper resistance system multicopper oxidase [Halothiobacillus sp.]|jgi:CopA family copper-resistance protein|uniref:copper resistance system multicopper oxidase n=1 Tax=Halothiobacillus sp. TaxID=1891311 RepID=UPI0026303F7E|nr:copper resistance system multicopper oxidase [Halothiobacillus sp.]MDD4966707.1 copper resistance system multicopper oxidase [Halothiobacillus sp.]MDY0147980.1 copper resistance system multicopper oxidase [Halothiobacillus sp.]
MSIKSAFQANTRPINSSRRIFIQGLVAGGVMAALGLNPAEAATINGRRQPPSLRGTEFDLVIDERPVNFTGQPRTAMTINGSIPGPTLRWREGDVVTLRVTNRLKVSTSLHWHGIILPFEMDGVPGLTYEGIAPGTTFTYRFRVAQSGTYWYHSHTGFQEQNAVYGAIVIDPAQSDRVAYDQDHVVMLNDWSDSSPDFIFNRLKTADGYYNYVKPDLRDLIRQSEKMGFGKAVEDRLMWDKMRMSPRDLLDVTGATYTYLMNGNTPAGDWTALFRPGERIRLRFINGSSMSYFDVRIPGLKMTVVAADGQDVHPVTVDEFRIGVAEIYDVIVEPAADQAYCIFAQSLDRSGYARGTLTPHVDLRAPIPPMDPVPTLSMADMGMDMSSMNMSGMDMSAMLMGDHAKDNGSAGNMSMHNGHMGGMDMSKQKSMAGMSHDRVSQHGTSGMSMGNHAMKGMADRHPEGAAHGAMSHNPMDLPGLHNRNLKDGTLKIDWHPKTEHGVGVGMEAQQVSMSLSDPGAGLRNNGRKVLTYGDLRGIDGPISPQEPARGIELHLTGNMNRYIWGFNGVSYRDAAPIELKYGETVRIVLINDTMMNHPIHLHGMWSELENDRGEYLARKHTLSVAPGHAISYRVNANAIGRWAYHCHLLYHMNAGMFREVRVV